MIIDLIHIKDGQITEIDYMNDKVLVYRENTHIYVTSAYCTYYDCPLIKGVQNGHTIRCPYDGACYNLKTGTILEYPGLDDLLSFKVKRINETLYVIKPQSFINYYIKDSAFHIYVIGSGPCGLICAETLRKNGHIGPITIIAKDINLPYDRPQITKTMDVSNFGKIAFRCEKFYAHYNINLRRGTVLTNIDFESKAIQIQSGHTYMYDKLLIALGSSSNVPEVPGTDLGNVFTVLRLQDAQNLYNEIGPEKHVVIIGNSFVGMEIASVLAGKAKRITVVMKTDVPFQQVFGREVGTYIMDLHKANGINFITNATLIELKGNGNKVSRVILSNGIRIKCDICVLGTGYHPVCNQLFASQNKLELNDFGLIEVNEYMETNIPDVYAGGVVSFPLFLTAKNFESYQNFEWDKVYVQHFQMAHKHGQIAALNMLDKKIAIKSVPYFYTTQYGKDFRYVGYITGPTNIIIHSNTTKNKIVAYYIKDDIIRAVLTHNRDPVASIIAELMINDKHWFMTRKHLAFLEPMIDDETYVETLKEFLYSDVLLHTKKVRKNTSQPRDKLEDLAICHL